MSEQSRSYRQIRSAVLAEVAHLEWEQAVTVLVSALNERAVEGGFQAKVELVPLWSTKGRTAAWTVPTSRRGRAV